MPSHIAITPHPFYWITVWPVHRSIGWTIGWLCKTNILNSIGWSFDLLTVWSVFSRPVDRSIRWPFDSLPYCLCFKDIAKKHQFSHKSPCYAIAKKRQFSRINFIIFSSTDRTVNGSTKNGSNGQQIEKSTNRIRYVCFEKSTNRTFNR